MTFGESFLSDRPRESVRPYCANPRQSRLHEVSTSSRSVTRMDKSVERLGSRIIVVTIVKHVGGT